MKKDKNQLRITKFGDELEEIPEEFNGSAAFEAYFEAAETAGFSKEEMAIYIKDMTTKWDIELAMKEHLEKGRKEGREEGRTEGLQEGRKDAIVEMAKKMLGLGLLSRRRTRVFFLLSFFLRAVEQKRTRACSSFIMANSLQIEIKSPADKCTTEGLLAVGVPAGYDFPGAPAGYEFSAFSFAIALFAASRSPAE